MTVPFHSAELLIIEHDGQPYIPMKSVVEGMGLTWQSQHEKLKNRFNSTITEIMIVAQDGKNRLMTCLPLKKLFGWMMTISPNKVKPELKETIIKYQDECDDVLWSHWTGKLNTQRKAFDEKLSKAKGSMSSYGMHDRKREKKINAKRLEDWKSKNLLLLDFSGKGGEVL